MTRDPAPSANSVSVVAGVSDTIFWGAPARASTTPSSPVSVRGNGAGVAVAAGITDPVAPGGIDTGVADAPEQPARPKSPMIRPAIAIRDARSRRTWRDPSAGRA